jgi:hypothetical protein
MIILGGLKFEGKLTNNQKEIADTLNKHFMSVAENIITENSHNDSSINNMENTTPINYLLQCFKCTFPNFKLKLSSTGEIKNIIKSLKTKNSLGYDKISTKLLKFSSPFIISPLTHICK